MKKRLFAMLLAALMILPLFGAMKLDVYAATLTEAVVKQKLDAFITKYPSGNTWTGSFDDGKECYGFAKMVMYNVFGDHKGWLYDGTATQNMVKVASITNFSSTNVKSLLKKAKCGDILQLNTPKQHTMVVYSVGDSSFCLYDCNYTGACKISKRNCNYSFFSNWNSSKLTLLRSANYSVTPTLTVTYNANGGTVDNSIVGYRYTVVPSVGLNLRKAAGTSSEVIKTLKKDSVFDVYTSDGTKTANGYTWGKTTVGNDTGWVVISDSTLAKKGNAIRNPDFYLSSSMIYTSSSAKIKTQEWECGTSKSGGLINASSFGLVRKGYTFVGWSLTADGSTTIFDQNDTSLKAEDINPKVKSSDQESVLYAIWSENLKTVTNVEVAHLPDQTTYYVGETIDLTGLKLKVTYSDDTYIETEECVTGDFDSSTPGTCTIPIIYQDLYTSFEVTVIEPHISMEDEMHLARGSSKTLSATTTPANAEIIWSSSNPKVATVENGTVVGIADGTTAIAAEITVNAITYTSVCTVIVGTGVTETHPSNSPIIMVSSKNVSAGAEFTVTVSVENNPGVMALTLVPEFSDKLTLVKAENGNLISDYTFGKSYFWTANNDVVQDGVLMELTFTAEEELEPGDYTVSFRMWDSSNEKEETVEFAIVPGVITVTDITWGDANGDFVVNSKDIVRLKNYFANLDDETGLSTTELFPGADANGDGTVNSKDIVRLKNYFANLDAETGLSSVILGPAV